MKSDNLQHNAITERLRGVPMDDWSKQDFLEEHAAHVAAAAENFRKAETAKWIVDTFRKLSEEFPGEPIANLVDKLPEPERSIARDIVFAPVKFSDLPVQKSNRNPWHDAIEQTIVKRLNHPAPTGAELTEQVRSVTGYNFFTTDDLLDEARIPVHSRKQASKYAEQLLSASECRRITA